MELHPSVYIAPTATVTGDVGMESGSSAWFGAVIRGDDAPIRVGERSNVQDNAVLHVDRGFPTTIGRGVTIGHGAIIHGATVEDECLIGMGCMILNGARIGTLSIVAAGALVPEGMQVPPRSVVMGMPGKVVRQVNDADIERTRDGVQIYVDRAIKYKKESG